MSEEIKDTKPIEAEIVEGEEVSNDSSVKKQETEEEREARLAKQQESDSRSIYVGNVDFKTTPTQLETFFKSSGVIERITILFDRYTGLPKGYAYIEFENGESVESAIKEFDGQDFRGRELKVTAKRTNLPRMGNSGRGRGRGGRGSFRGGRGDFRGRGRGVRGGIRGRGVRGGSRGRGGRGGRGGKGEGEVEESESSSANNDSGYASAQASASDAASAEPKQE